MGIKVPPLIVVPPGNAGNGCGICWGPGKDFGDGDTPDHIWVNFSGINKTDDWLVTFGEPIEGLFMLDQNPAVACSFDALTVDFIILVTFFPGLVGIFVEYRGVATQWLSGVFTPCEIFNTDGAQFGFEGGSALLIIPEVD